MLAVAVGCTVPQSGAKRRGYIVMASFDLAVLGAITPLVACTITNHRVPINRGCRYAALGTALVAGIAGAVVMARRDSDDDPDLSEWLVLGAPAVLLSGSAVAAGIRALFDSAPDTAEASSNPPLAPPPDRALVPAESPATPAAEQRIDVPAGIAHCDSGRRATCDGTPVPAFSIDPTPVTRSDYESCIKAGDCPREAPPFANTAKRIEWANTITWKQARRFCRARGGELPTEGQWERAREVSPAFVITDAAADQGEWLDGWYQRVDDREAVENTYYSARLVIGGYHGKSYRWGAKVDTGFQQIGFRCAYGRNDEDNGSPVQATP